MLKITIKEDGVLKRVGINVGNVKKWMPELIRDEFGTLGRQVTGHMRLAISRNRYRGDLESSIKSTFDAGKAEVTISPTVKRGRYDGGLILEKGTKKITNLPFAPIKIWAAFRGIPAFPVWYKIRKKGVAAHPFLDRTLKASSADINTTAQRIADRAANEIVR